jgi:two-component system, NarL family, response regulator NreC
MTRVLLVDDHGVVRAGLRLVLEWHGFEVTGEAADVDSAVAAAADLQPDVAVVDLLLPLRGGIAAIAEMGVVSPATRFVVLSNRTDTLAVRQAFAAGAHGYVSKHAGEETLVEALAVVARGDQYLHPALGASLATPEPLLDEDLLSPRERDVLSLLALGHTNREIGNLLAISARTAESHRLSIMTKLRLRSRSQLVLYALSRGLIGPG